MIEHADQLVLNYVSKAADAAHGVLRTEQRLDFARRLRARIEAERGGSGSPREVARVLARFGDPAALVEREARRLAGDTRRFPAIVDDPGGSAGGRGAGEHRMGGEPGRGLPFAGLRRVAMSSANPLATGGRDARTVVKERPREVLALMVLVAAALLVPFGLPTLAIFPVPLVVWAAGTAIVLLSESWDARDRFLGAGAPLLGYAVGGVLVGGLRVGAEPGFERFMTEFWAVSGTTFMIGTALGVLWLGYRLLDDL
ncbi:hypothetical protein [Nonomuraea sp. NPDC050783]|uniref:hypothetical protein n=1 Tax=Nonomuraea sp. NPDC050783 TaxID=3154634 RepID=UPI003465550E